ncbi:MAG: class I SAM-dependent methyltransferase [Candidatus Sumerlaeaceae bacterium]
MRLAKLETIPPAGGHFDELAAEGAAWEGLGWIFRRPFCITRAELFADGEPVGPCEEMKRPDVIEACAWAGESRPFGFRFRYNMSQRATPVQRFDVIGFEGRRAIARVSCFCPPPTTEQTFPIPPPELAIRVSGSTGEKFRLQGLKMYTDLLDAMRRFAVPLRGRLLDWGCGCGRVLRWFLSRNDFDLLNCPSAIDARGLPLGCDVDPEAIEWCRENLGAAFELVSFDPPTALPASSYDVVLACSVLTHLDRERQIAWLKEVHRWLVPGGHFFASTNAEFAFRSKHPHVQPQGWRGWIEKKAPTLWRATIVQGIYDEMRDPNMRWVVDEETYRMVFQSRRYTEELCSRFFDVLGYIECGLDGFQDLIVCRKRTV